MGYYREAVNAATLAIGSQEVTVGAKAYFRRAQAYRAMDEYRYIRFTYIYMICFTCSI
jgi:hypothetical protein